MAFRTITRPLERTRAPRAGDPCLFVALQSERPLQPGARFRLTGARKVIIGRGEQFSLQREGDEVRLGLPDPNVSARHLELEAVLGGWMRNGDDW